MALAKVIDLPTSGLVSVPAGLRNLADQIEAGQFGDAHNLVWVLDCGDRRIEVGLLGGSAEAGAVAHFLLAVGQRQLENG